MFVILGHPMFASDIAPTTPAPVAVQPAQLDRAIESVLEGPEFRWRLRPRAETETKTPGGPIKRFVREGVETLREILRKIGRLVNRIVDWFERHFGGGERAGEKANSDGGSGGAVARVLLYVLIAAAGLLILWVIWLVARSAHSQAATVLAARAVTATTPDLRDENVEAAQLPADGWLGLAREQAGRGEWRLALRALYLATLARLASEGLISPAKFKTNLDYEREVRRRALSREGIAAAFAVRRREFEDVWYGRAQPAEANVRAWMAELER